ncbi:MAG: zf-HC2 domain-containing protein [Acidobacteriia bacterium]|nr:zf-HC2 domain-containing protein [Terriglobia bacterium]
MDHDTVVRKEMTEKYLLNELDPAARDEFEEHFFDCPACALDVRAGSLFIEQSKVVLTQKLETAIAPSPIRTPAPGDSGWLGWLCPTFAAPALALLLVIIAYQNLVTYPRLQQALNRPQVLPWAQVNIGTWGSSGPVIRSSPGQGFLLFVRIPPEDGYHRYTADLYNPAGKVEWSLTIPATTNQDQWSLQVPGAKREAGTYILSLRGISSAGESKEVGRASFELQIQK